MPTPGISRRPHRVAIVMRSSAIRRDARGHVLGRTSNYPPAAPNAPNRLNSWAKRLSLEIPLRVMGIGRRRQAIEHIGKLRQLLARQTNIFDLATRLALRIERRRPEGSHHRHCVSRLSSSPSQTVISLR
jgi:hypothetical protein